MHLRCVASHDEKKKCDKQPEVEPKLLFGDADNFASVLVSQIGQESHFIFSLSKRFLVNWQQEALNCVLRFHFFSLLAQNDF